MPIPEPLSNSVTIGTVRIDLTTVRLDAALEGAREGVLAMLAMAEPSVDSGGVVIDVRYRPAFSAERYVLSVSLGGVTIEAGATAGAVYAAASVAQLLAENGGSLPYCLIEDEPRFAWRGFLFDVGRHFFPMKTIRQVVNLLAYYKYNRLHLHLSEDQGFRFESENYPLLNSVGSYRNSTIVKHGGMAAQDRTPHGGYYAKAELKELVRYAKARGIEIVPEIDMPGHALSVMAAYPELACFPEPVEVATRFGVTDFSKKLYCAGSEKTFEFLYHLLDEVMEVFPFEWIHLGGDEAVKDEWKRCEACQTKRKELGLRDERELQGYFLNRVMEYAALHGRRAIVWNDGLCDTLSGSAVCQRWIPWTHEGPDRTAKRVNAGGEAILSPFTRLYFDYPYAMTPLGKTYRYQPKLPGVRKQRQGNILGVEAALWTEWIDAEDKLFFNMLPRLAATAETAWSGRGGRYAGFRKRLQPHYALYRRLGLTYAAHAEQPQPIWKRIRDAFIFAAWETHIELLRQRKTESKKKERK